MLADVLDGGRDFYFRLVGTNVAYGIDPTGQRLREAVPAGFYREHITALFARGAAGPGALYTRTHYDYDEAAGPRTIARIFMPLASDGAVIDKMMIGQMRDRQIHADLSAWQANPPSSEPLNGLPDLVLGVAPGQAVSPIVRQAADASRRRLWRLLSMG